MCGIAGFYGFEDKVLLKRMCNVIRHRGPDDYGYFTDRNVCMGNRRLSIIDLKTGKQPIHNEEETLWIVYNGEAYNYRELKEDLESRGHRFYTNSDTEAIVHAYEEYGEDCVNRIRGMFAFAIWDSEKGKLFLARDRLGIKPLYYSKNGGKLFFGSEIKSILQNGMERKVDRNALGNYLTFGYIPAPDTMFEGIKKLPQGHTLTLKGGRMKISKYWDIKYNPVKGEENEMVSRLKSLLEESVRIRMMSEVPLGIFLSGGLDSSSVVAIMSRMTDKVKTISASFETGGYFDESGYARAVSERFGTDHKEIVLKGKCSKLLPKIIWHFDEPSADPSSFAEYLISEKAKKYVTVSLVGEGSDELFAGYRQNKIMGMAYKYHKIIPGHLKRKTIPRIARKISERSGRRKIKRGMEFLTGFTPTLGDNKESYKQIIQIFPENDKKEIFPGSREERVISSHFSTKDFRKGMFSFELKVSLPDILLMNVDKMTMAHSVEARVPFLDHRIVEFSSRLPFNMKLRNMDEKYILKKAMRDDLPKEIIRRKKHPFAVPLVQWFESDMEGLINDYMSEKEIRKQGLFSQRYIEKIERDRNYNQLWPILFFQVWHRKFIENHI